MKLKSADTLRALMEQDQFSLARLARYAGCSKGFISHLLSGRRSSCTAELGDKIAEALGVPTTVLFEVRVSPSSGSIDNQHMKKAS
ncbi:helix-turn-helix domain-containing protein [Janibacter terrae]|uniref:helix-turn-helix domain-containing protein n=1 Tax=Janibacter terrae TaxID=103817 RepID=UPI000AD71D57|nr:helix-turn-helix transcriptional regulator [Janibacter terrae]